MSATADLSISSGAAATPVSPTGRISGHPPPELVVSAAAINSEPVELEATPVSPSQVDLARRGSKAVALDAFAAEKSARSVGDGDDGEVSNICPLLGTGSIVPRSCTSRNVE